MLKYAKAIVAVGGFIVVVGNSLTGAVDAQALFDAGVTLLTALGVYGVKNAG
jgi:hypothetical protein